MIDYLECMEIESIKHKALAAFVATDKSKGLPADLAERLRKMLFLIVQSADFTTLVETLPNYGLHPLKGDRAGEWAMKASRNWRLTFRKVDETTIGDVDLEDYH
ncbi:type II toxin-antitoxin system RelE/ParE family toxin [Sphingomonadaceae bacterium G21617-S1]|nr:type II toxin-antitoxin system RelE/ParE family toxin [Sphingomonadaceae bacterium G21617-S1]